MEVKPTGQGGGLGAGDGIVCTVVVYSHDNLGHTWGSVKKTPSKSQLTKTLFMSGLERLVIYGHVLI